MLYKSPSNKRKILTATILSTLLFSALIARLSLVNLTEANPYLTAFYKTFDIEPVNDPPMVSLGSPTNGAPCWNGTGIVFMVFMPDSWKWAASPELATENWSVFVGQIKSVTCALDQTEILRNSTVYGRQELEPLRDYHPRNIIYSKDVGFLSPGPHNLTITVEAYTLYCTYDNLWHNVSVSSTFTFITTIELPEVTSLSPEPSPSSTSSPTPSTEPEQTEPTAPAPSPTPQEPSPSQESEQTQGAFPTTLIIASVITVIVIGTNLLVYFKKRKR